MKILFVWTGVTGYMADCWRELQQQQNVDLKVVVELADSGKAYDASKTLSGLNCEIVTADRSSSEAAFSKFSPWKADVIFAGGWRSPATRLMLKLFPDIPKVFCLDMPWRWQFRCFAARFMLWRFLRRFIIAFVPGKKSRFYARWLGFKRENVRERLYSVDIDKLSQAADELGRQNRRGFLYVGRYSSEKRVDLIEKAYAKYRELGGSWELDCYGQGGKFVQPSEMPRVYGEHACLVLASSFDPWPLVILEAKGSGMEVIASDRCGNCDELKAVKVPYGDVRSMAQAMLEVERTWALRKEKSLDLSMYNCKAWAERVVDITLNLMKCSYYCPGVGDKSNGMAVVAHQLSESLSYPSEFIVHGAWLPLIWLNCISRLFKRQGYIRMTHGAFSPVYLKGRIRKRILRPIERFFLRRAKKVLVTCRAEQQWVETYEPKAKTEIIDLKSLNWSRADGSRAIRRKGSNENVRILYMGRRHPLKGINYLEGAVKKLNADLNLGKGIVYELEVATKLTGKEKEAAFDRCDVVCLPTLSENFGIVVAEALARGKIVLTTDGAPAWANEPRTNPDGSTRLVFLEGYVGALESEREEMLARALAQLV